MTFFDNFHEQDILLKRWFKAHQRDLPWRVNRTPYRVWLSEIMLQQTQVATVIDYYLRFTHRFPTVQDLATASEDEVLSLWSGLGYYSRARNLHRAAKLVYSEYSGVFPSDYKTLQTLPGVGSYTAGAIMAFALDKPAPVVDGNIARVLSRLLNDRTRWGDGPGKKHFESLSLSFAEKARSPLLWQEGLMELGATVCKPSRPDCASCPFQSSCLARQHNTIEQLPVLMKKPEKTRLDVYCELIYNNDHIWLEKNQSTGLFKGLYAPPLCEPFESTLTVKRTLTHRNLHLHAKLIPMDIAERPSAHWIKRSALNQIGLSTAVKTLLQKAALLSILLTSACSVKGPSIRYLTRIEQTLPGRQDPVVYAKQLVGKSHAKLGGKDYRADCSGTVRAIYDAGGIWLGNASSTDDMYRYVQKNGQLDTRAPKPKDLIFFNAGDSKELAHIGFVEEVLPDGTVLFIHHISGMIVRSRMNLKSPNLQTDPQSGARLNHILRRGKRKGYTAGQLFVAFGRMP
ncbi:MAG: A/G-specific adenine glycosylase [Myxococcota bacterium]